MIVGFDGRKSSIGSTKTATEEVRPHPVDERFGEPGILFRGHPGGESLTAIGGIRKVGAVEGRRFGSRIDRCIVADLFCRAERRAG